MNVMDSVNQLVESRIRPALQSHGGDIAVVSFDEDTGVLSASLQGACGTCPFAQETLRMQVEAVLKEQIPQVLSVVRV
ncbi:NifU family protein [Dethiosulfovibrio salsuginis]|uniref:Fe-S cluster biogenesis protein NfuA, 4Fe-4S-binding domain n=1 Tax=Dethiosulfovibrio salsuginis TaxID=561720 RepID=A0A1X7KV68_9BACT|nr:NifU family protein [Dethiosulfovibrio salsuginis]SMG44771.1 Fe-S cluster biogenesis protein NfuA, 4Fe-4S-binding domain [Dethiosulfovibrio salsuginis]